MKVARKTLERELQLKADEIIDNNPRRLYEYLYNKYNYPMGRAADFISRRASFDEASEFELFMMADGFDNLSNHKSLGYYFTEVEVETYSKAKYEPTNKAKFPLKFKMVQITPDQWIGKTSARELMSLRDAQITSYNENIQRTLRKIIKGGRETYVIKINKNAVKSIRQSMEEERYIPNTITLNIPDSPDSDFSYNPDTMTLTIKSAKSLDIIDGYHRFVAITNATDIDKGFDYPMELRITNYAEDKGKRFIYQEDQKTQMTKSDSATYNVDDDAVRIATKLNEDSGFELSGEVNRNKGLIKMSDFTLLVKRIFLKNVSRKQSRATVLKTEAILRDGINAYLAKNFDYLDNPMSWTTQLLLYETIKYCDDKGINTSEIPQIMKYLEQNQDRIENKRLVRKIPSEPLLNQIVDLISEGGW